MKGEWVEGLEVKGLVDELQQLVGHHRSVSDDEGMFTLFVVYDYMAFGHEGFHSFTCRWEMRGLKVGERVTVIQRAPSIFGTVIEVDEVSKLDQSTVKLRHLKVCFFNRNIVDFLFCLKL